MDKIIIVGNGICAIMMKHYIEDTDFGEVCGFTVDEQYIKDATIECVPVIASKDILTICPPQDYKLILAIGYSKMGDVRKALFRKYKEMGYTFLNFIHPSAIISKRTNIGEGNIILEGVICEMDTSIGDANLIYCGAIIGHDTSIGSYSTMAGRASTAGCCKVGNNCFLGVSSVVRDCVKLEDYVLVGEGACAFRDMPAYSVVKAPKSEIVKDLISIDVDL